MSVEFLTAFTQSVVVMKTLQKIEDQKQWAQQQFCKAQLGDLRRTHRLVKVAAQMVTD